MGEGQSNLIVNQHAFMHAVSTYRQLQIISVRGLRVCDELEGDAVHGGPVRAVVASVTLPGLRPVGRHLARDRHVDGAGAPLRINATARLEDAAREDLKPVGVSDFRFRDRGVDPLVDSRRHPRAFDFGNRVARVAELGLAKHTRVVFVEGVDLN